MKTKLLKRLQKEHAILRCELGATVLYIVIKPNYESDYSTEKSRSKPDSILTTYCLKDAIIYQRGVVLDYIEHTRRSLQNWRYIRDEEYNGFSIQRKRRFLLWEWWSNEYLTGSKEAAKKFVNVKNGMK